MYQHPNVLAITSVSVSVLISVYSNFFLPRTISSHQTLTIKWDIIVLLMCFDGVHPSLKDDSSSAKGPPTLVIVDRGLPDGAKRLKQGLLRR